MSWKRLSLRWQVVITVLLIPIIMLPVFFFVGSRYRKAYREIYWEKADLVAAEVQMTLEKVAPYITSLADAPGLEESLRATVKNVEEFAFIALVDVQGTVLLHSEPGWQGRSVSELANLPLVEGQLQVTRRLCRNGDTYLVYRTLSWPDEETKLYIVVGEVVDLVDSPLWAVVPVVLISIGGGLLVSILFVSLEFLVLRPLRHLAHSAEIIGAGNWDYETGLLPAEDLPGELGIVAHAFNEMARRLFELVSGLEERVVERTQALQEKTRRLQASSIVSKEASRIRNVPSLLETTVKAISEHFGFYDAAIFLLDDAKEWAILRAASSELGAQMVGRGLRMRLSTGNGQSIIGFVAESGLPRVISSTSGGETGDASSTEEDEDVQFVIGNTIVAKKSIWTETRSEIAVPLKLEGDVLGVLDVQSTDPAAFGEEDVDTLQLMADQVSVALTNARLLEQTQDALTQLKELQDDYSRRGWARVSARLRPMAYEYNRVDVSPVPPFPVPPDLETKQISHSIVMDGNAPVMMEPMRVQDRIIGYLGLSDPQRVWTEDEIALVEGVSEQVGLALENARLFEEAQITARQQALLNQVLQVSATPGKDPEAVLLEIATALAQGLGMGIGLFTFVDAQSPTLHPHALISRDGEPLTFFEEDFDIAPDQHIFLRGLTRPELGRMLEAWEGDSSSLTVSPSPNSLPDFKEGGLSLASGGTEGGLDIERVLYVPIRTARAQSGFIAMMQQGDDAPLDPDTRALAQNLANQVAVVMDNLHLAEQTRRRSDELASLYQVSLILGERLEPSEVLQMIIELGVSLLKGDSSGLFIYEEDTDELVLTLDFQGDVGDQLGYRIQSGEGLAGRALAQNKILTLDDYNTWTQGLPVFKASPFRSMMALPMVGRFGSLGVLYVRARRRGVFTENEVRIGELYAARAVAAWENARLYQETTRSAEELRALNDASLELFTLLNVQEVLDQAANWARRIFGAQAAVVFFREPSATDEVEGLQQPTFLKGESVDVPERLVWDPERQPREGGMTRQVLNTGENILIQDARKHTQVRPALVEAGMLAQMAVPLRLRQEFLGAIFVYGEQVGQFDERNVRSLELFATQVAAAIQNALQFAETQSALSVVARQARYQTNVSQAVALLAERGGIQAALPNVLALLGEAAGVEYVFYFPAHLDEGDAGDGESSMAFHWDLEAAWSADDVPALADDARLQRLPVDDFPFWAEQLQRNAAPAFRTRDFPEVEREFWEAFGFQTFLGLNVRPQGEVFPGFIGFARLNSDALWQAEEVAALQTVAAALSNTIVREQLFGRVQEALDTSDLLYRAGAALNTAQSYQGVLDVLLEYTVLDQGLLAVTINLFNRPWLNGTRPDWAGVMAREGSVSADVMPSRVYFAEGIEESAESPAALIRILRAEEPTVIRNVQDAAVKETVWEPPARAYFTKLHALGVQGMLFVPMVVAGRWIGYLQAVYAEPVIFDEEALRSLMSLVQQAAVVVQNINQLEASRARARREQMIREITERIQAAPDVQGVLQSAVRELGRAFGTPKNVVQLQFKPEDKSREDTT